jgi:hypothetical protein
MTVIVTPTADNGSAYIVLASFTETLSDGSVVDVTPESVVWSLTDVNGNIINGRDDVSLTPATTVAAVCYGDDILLDDGEERRITFDCVYNSVEFGSNLPLSKQASFQIDKRFQEEV